MSSSPLAIARTCLNAYVDKDRAAIEAVLADDFHFTSPIDNALDRATYLARCWPNSAKTQSFEYLCEIEQGERAFIVYEAHATDGRCFRNAEVHTVRDDKLIAIEVYFGWKVPHNAPVGGFIENDGAGHA